MKTLDGQAGIKRHRRNFEELRLSRDKEVEMLTAIETCGDAEEKRKLAWKLCEANYGLVMKLACRYHRYYPSTPIDDMFMSGLIWCHKAAMRFLSSKNTVFSTYATWYVRQGIRQAIGKAAKEKSTDNSPLGGPLIDRRALQAETRRDRSSRGHYLETGYRDASPIDNESVIDSKAWTILTDRQRNVVSMRYGIGTEPMKLREIGDRFGVSRERVRQIHDKAVARLRSALPKDAY
jgi:RNA polymerase primary sigma factor